MSDNKTEVFTETHAHTRVITLNRPERHHAINTSMANQLMAAIDEAESDDATKVIIVGSSGERAFCAGQDMQEMNSMPAAEAKEKGSPAGTAVAHVAKARKPIIAAINGVCYGGGVLLALACDIRLASDSAIFRFPGAAYGLVVGAAWLPRVVGASTAKEWIYTARKIEAAEAHDRGLVSHIYARAELMETALEMANMIAENAATAVQASKRVIDMASLVDAADATEREYNHQLRGSEEQAARFHEATTKVTGKTRQ